MANVTKNVKILQVTKTTAEWALIDTIIDNGLLCIEFTADNQTLAKVGDGLHTYSALPYIGTADVSMSNYYTRGETDAKIQDAIEDLNIGNISVKGVVSDAASLPESGMTAGDMYLVGPKEGTTNEYDQYVYTANDGWVNMGTRETEEIDLSNYVTQIDFAALQAEVDALRLDQDPHTNRAILDQITAPFTTELETKLNDIDVFEGAVAADPEQEIEASAGTSGLVPAPQIGDETKFLRGDGTWQTVSSAAYDDTELRGRIETLEEETIKTTDDLVFQCSV
jgi:hypothetical protein